MEKLKIGLVSAHSFFNPGGVKNHIVNLQKEYKKRGYVCKIIAPRRSGEKDYGRDMILLGTSFRLPLGGSQGDFTFNFNPGAINRLLKKEKFDLLHFHNFGPLTWQILSSRYLPQTNILTWHASLQGANYFKMIPFTKDLLLRKVDEKIDGIIGVAPFNLDIFKRLKKPKAVIPNGIDLTIFNTGVPKIEKYLDGKINILFLGRIEERKGLIYVLRALKILNKKFNDLRLIVVGEGPLQEECQQWAVKNKVNNVVFEGGKVSGVPSYYRTADIYCAPAIYGESFGIVLIEAMASGTPVVAFANDGYKTVLGKGAGAQFLAKPRDYRTLAAKLELLIKSPALRLKMAKWGLKEAQKYAWPKVASKVLAFYDLCRKH